MSFQVHVLDKSTDPITLALRSLQDQGAMVCAVETFCQEAFKGPRKHLKGLRPGKRQA